MAAASLSHELTHFIKDYSPELYGQLKSFVTGAISTEELSRLVDQQQRWDRSGTMSYDAALDEVVANACQTMLMDTKAIGRLARQNMKLGQKIVDYIADWSQRVEDAFADVDTSDGAIYAAVRAMEKSLDQLQERWDAALEDAANARRAELTVLLDRKRINREFNYRPTAKNTEIENASGQAYTTACIAIPSVIEDGIEIEHHKNHKKRGYPTWTYAAPVLIDNERGNLAVVVKETSDYFYDVHSVLTPDGHLLVLDSNKKAEASDGGASQSEEVVAPSMLSADITIPDTAADGKTPSADLARAFAEDDAAAAESGTQLQQWDNEHNEWAPAFFSRMQNVVDEWTNGKGQKLPAKMAAGQLKNSPAADMFNILMGCDYSG